MPRGGARPVRTMTSAKPVSGPGKLAERTDMKTVSDPNVYGDRKRNEELMSGAPMAKSQPVPAAKAAVPQRKVKGLFDPTDYPNEPVMSGVSVGAGMTPEKPIAGKYDMVNQYMPMLEELAADQNASPALKALVNYIKVSGQ